jgi:hypothetical protein
MAKPPMSRSIAKGPYPCLTHVQLAEQDTEPKPVNGKLSAVQSARILTLLWGSEEAALNEMNDRLFTNAADVREALKGALNRRFFISPRK